jgi:hypothetical protein
VQVRTTILALAGLAIVPAALAQTPRQLTARELFYAAADQPATAPAKAAPAAKPTAVTTARRTPRPAAPVRQTPAPVTEVATAPAGGSYIKVAYAPQQGIPLGLRYTLLKRVDGRMVEVAPDTVFHAGDRIQVSVEANDGGYLYIIHQGSSGAWKPLFPSAEIEDGDNRVAKGRLYVMPPKSRFYFDEQAGAERLFIVLSRKPEPDLERLIYSLRGGTPAPVAEPVARPARAPVMLASNLQIDDTLVGRLRNVYARDLVIEKVDDDAAPAAAGRQEKAVYVVNASGSPDSRVVADIVLTHR